MSEQVLKQKGDKLLHALEIAEDDEAYQMLCEEPSEVLEYKGPYHTTPLQIAARSGQLRCIYYLLNWAEKNQKNSINEGDEIGMTPLHWAAYRGKNDCILALVEKKADISKANVFGNTALHQAAYNGHVEALKIILSSGKVGKDDRLNDTQIDEAVRLLNKKNEDHRTATQIALYRKKEQAYRFLKSMEIGGEAVREKLRSLPGLCVDSFLEDIAAGLQDNPPPFTESYVPPKLKEDLPPPPGSPRKFEHLQDHIKWDAPPPSYEPPKSRRIESGIKGLYGYIGNDEDEDSTDINIDDGGLGEDLKDFDEYPEIEVDGDGDPYFSIEPPVMICNGTSGDVYTLNQDKLVKKKTWEISEEELNQLPPYITNVYGQFCDAERKEAKYKKILCELEKEELNNSMKIHELEVQLKALLKRRKEIEKEKDATENECSCASLEAATFKSEFVKLRKVFLSTSSANKQEPINSEKREPKKEENSKTAEANKTIKSRKLFHCPITEKLMEDPVMAADGHSYEKTALVAYIEDKKKKNLPIVSPVTNQEFSHLTLIPNVGLKEAIQSQKSK